MIAMRTKQFIVDTVAFLFMLLWLYAGASKLMEYDQFKFQLGKSPFIQEYASLIAIALPIGEILIAAMMVPVKTRLLGIYASFFLMLIFTGYIYAMLHYSDFLPCSCGGLLNSMSWYVHLIFNIIFTIMALVAIMLSSKPKPDDNKIEFTVVQTN
jgi:uncharacterized membrane protein YphA (DoxX/SURF4 family)